MARGRKSGPSRLELRRQSEAAEAREEEEDELEEEEEASDEEAEGDVEAEGDSDSDESGDDEEAPKAKAKKPVKKKAPTKRTRAVKEVRMRAVWKVFDNSNKVVDTFPFNQKAQAEELLAKKIEEKKGTFYLQMVKEQMEEG